MNKKAAFASHLHSDRTAKVLGAVAKKTLWTLPAALVAVLALSDCSSNPDGWVPWVPVEQVGSNSSADSIGGSNCASGTDTLEAYAQKCDAAMGGVTVPQFDCDDPTSTPVPNQDMNSAQQLRRTRPVEPRVRPRVAVPRAPSKREQRRDLHCRSLQEEGIGCERC